MSNAAYKNLHALALRARILGDPRRPGAEAEFQELERLGIVSSEDKGYLFCFPSREQLMEDTGIRSVHTVDAALDELSEMKIVKRITPAQPRLTRGLFGSNVYIIHPESFIGKFGTGDGDAKRKVHPVEGDGEQKLPPVEGTGSSLRNSDNCPLKSTDSTTTTNSLREWSPEVERVIEFFARAIGAEKFEPTEKDNQRIATLFEEGFSEEQICAGITRAVEQAREKGRTANLIFCARIVRSIYSKQSEIVPDNSKSSTGQIVASDGKSSAQIVPVASQSYAMLLDGLELDEQTLVEFVSLIALIEEHSQRTITKAEARRWKVLSDDFKELAVERGISSIALVLQAVEEALDAGSARNGYCAPKLARTILARWSKAQASKKKKSTPPKREIPPAVRVYREVRRRFPAQELWGNIATIVGTEESALAFWCKVLKTWVARGYNPMNIEGPLEWFKKREIPQNGSGKSAEPTRERRPVESLEVIQARMQQNAPAGVTA
jgi:DNA invertase Pin-like site-specific DNA recombinase